MSNVAYPGEHITYEAYKIAALQEAAEDLIMFQEDMEFYLGKGRDQCTNHELIEAADELVEATDKLVAIQDEIRKLRNT